MSEARNSIIDNYLSKLDKRQSFELEKIKKIVNKIAPLAEEAITYGVPGFTINGHFFIGFSAGKKFMSLYPASTAIELYADRLKGLKLSKGTIRFTVENPLPNDLLRDIVNFRLNEVKNKEGYGNY